MAFTAGQIPGISGRIYPPSLAGPLYPDGIHIYEETELTKIIKSMNVDLVVFSYSDVLHEEVMHKASTVLAAGADFMLLGPRSTMLRSSRKVVAVTAVKTGAGKSTIARLVVRLLRNLGLRVVVVRHPMPYGVLEKQVLQRFASLADLDLHASSVEEREEIEPHIREGNVVYAGVDYRAVLSEAEKEADVIVWDGGNNDFPFFQPDLYITVVDATRPGLETKTYPGETNVLMANVLVIHKADKATPDELEKLKDRLSRINPEADIIVTGSRTMIEDRFDLRGLRAVVLEDGPSVTHGGMSVGVGYDAAVKAGADVVDPKPYAVGTIANLYREYPHLGPVVPAIGYTEQQLRDLEKTLNNVPAEVVISSSPADFTRIVKVDKPFVRVWFEAYQISGKPLLGVVRSLLLKS